MGGMMIVPTSRPHPADPTILVVEDEVLIRLMVCEVLRDAGLKVIEAKNADEALACLRTEIGVDLLFTDIRMPGTMDGAELATRALADFPALKIVLTSGHMLPNEVPVGLPLLPKPYRMADAVLLILGAFDKLDPDGSEPGG